MTETGGATLVSGVAYSHRGQLAQMVYGGGTETRQYNELGQLTRIQMLATLNQAAFDVEYLYPATQNNGRMVGQKDWLTGEEVVYEYDSLNRLAAAATAGPEWGLTFGYDGFGNKTAQTVWKGTGPSYTVGVNAATNRIVGYSYDANGNQVVAAGTAYDIENRLTFHLNEHYGYTPDNERVLVRKAGGGWLQDRIYFYGVTGQVLVEYAAYWVAGEPGGLTLYGLGTRRYFGGKEIHSSLSARLVHDRLGSMVQWGNTRYGFYPFGEPKGTAGYTGGTEYATYRKDETGLHYAVNRYYQSSLGRFVTPDPYVASGGVGEPGSWNRYAYVNGDPVNFYDPEGLFAKKPEFSPHFEAPPVDWWGGGGLWVVSPLDPVDTQGPGRKDFIRVRNPSKTGAHQDRIRNVMNWIGQNIDADCARWLAGVGDAITGLLGDPSQLDTVSVGHGEFDTRTIAAFRGNNPNQTNLPPGFGITINTIGAFFAGGYVEGRKQYTLSANGYTGGTSQAQVAIILH
jgi:RHS repeat-associated protein